MASRTAAVWTTSATVWSVVCRKSEPPRRLTASSKEEVRSPQVRSSPYRLYMIAERISVPVTGRFGSEVGRGDWSAKAMRSPTCCTPASVPPVSGQSCPAWHQSTKVRSARSMPFIAPACRSYREMLGSRAPSRTMRPVLAGKSSAQKAPRQVP